VENVEKKFLVHFVNAVANIYNEYTEKFPEFKGIENEKDSAYVSDEKITVNVGFSGMYEGNMTLSFDKNLAFSVYKKVYEEDIKEVDDEILFMFSEFGNMIAGNAITSINNKITDADLRLAPPGVFYGEKLSFFNFKTSSFKSVFTTENGDIFMNVAVKEAKK